MSDIVLIPKTGKDDYSDPKSFRPISLTSFLFKLLEKIVKGEIIDKYLQINPLSINQHAFRSGSSCDTALSRVVDTIEAAICRKQYALAVFLDISGAFDNLIPSAAIQGMKEKGLPNFLVNWYQHYLGNRHIRASIKGVTKYRSLTKGTPQGGVLSPLVWNLAFEKLLALFDRGPVKIVGFADDACLVVTGHDPSILADLAQSAVDRAIEWGADSGLEFNARKTAAILFSHKRKILLPKNIKVNGMEVNYVESTKYLGVTLDSKLSFSTHIKSKISKAKSLLMSLRNAIMKNWGPIPQLIAWAYNSIVKPMLSYGSIIWGKQAHKHEKALTRLQRLALLLITNIVQSTPTKGLEVILGQEPLCLHLWKRGLASYFRNKKRNKTQWDGLGIGEKRGHVWYWEKELKASGLSHLDPESHEFPFTKDRNFFIETSGDLEPILENNICCYTDGSKKSDGSAGWSYVIRYPSGTKVTNSGPLHTLTSAFQAEGVALFKAIKRLALANSPVSIFTDCKGLLQMLMRKKQDSKLGKDCLDSLNKLSVRTKWVSLHWVRAHSGNIFNEEANLLARNAAVAGQAVLEEKNMPIQAAVLKAVLQSKVIAKWSHEWSELTSCRQTRRFWPHPDLQTSKKLLLMDRDLLGKIIQIMTGHGYMNYHLALKGLVVCDKCRFCGKAAEESWHIITECEALKRVRKLTLTQGNNTLKFPGDAPRLSGFIASIDSLLHPPRAQ